MRPGVVAIGIGPKYFELRALWLPSQVVKRMLPLAVHRGVVSKMKIPGRRYLEPYERYKNRMKVRLLHTYGRRILCLSQPNLHDDIPC